MAILAGILAALATLGLGIFLGRWLARSGEDLPDSAAALALRDLEAAAEAERRARAELAKRVTSDAAARERIRRDPRPLADVLRDWVGSPED